MGVSGPASIRALSRLVSVPLWMATWQLDDGQRRFGVPHVAYLPTRPPAYLARFAMWAAFPPSDYYRASVAMRPPRRAQTV